MKRIVALLVLVLVAHVPAGGQVIVDHTCVDATKIPKTHLDAVRTLDLFFCHASVGMGMMSGLRSLARTDPVRYTLTQAGLGAPATWFDANNGIIDDGGWGGMGGNGNPLGKIKGFEELIKNKGYGARADVAFMKFCYLDFGPQTNVTAVWTAYRDTFLSLEAAYPKVTFVRVTAALNALGTEGNKRAEFNKSLRDYCRSQRKVLFDLAAIESHDPDGHLARDDHGNETIYAGYTDDNGHLSSVGRERMAKALWWLFARVAGWTVGPTALETTAATPVLAANGAAETPVTARLRDAQNALYIENEERVVTFSLIGTGRLTGTNPVTTQNGVARITYRAGSSVGPVRVVASASGLTPDEARIDLIANRAPDAPGDLECDGKVDPTGVPTGYPVLTWTFRDADTSLGDRQSAYQVILADNPHDILNDVGNVWDSGKVLTAGTSANPCGVPLRPGIRYHWKARTWDASAVPGAYSAAATFGLANDLGYAARVDLTAGPVDLGTGASLDIHAGNATGLTIEMWLYRTEQGRATILVDRFASNAGGYRVGIDGADHVYFRTKGKKDRRVTAIQARIDPGKWHHVACQTSGSEGLIFIDGIQRGRNGLISLPYSVFSARAVLDTAGALVDDLRISDVQRYSGNFTPPAAPFKPDASTRGLWPFDEGGGWTAQDVSGHGNTGRLDPVKSWGAGYRARAGHAPPLVFHTGKATPGATIQIKVVGSPSAPAILGISFYPRPLSPPIALPGLGNLYLGWPLVLLPLGAIPAEGVVTTPVYLPAVLPPPISFPVQALVGSRLSDCVVIDVR
jgi:hypothetical protein